MFTVIKSYMAKKKHKMRMAEYMFSDYLEDDEEILFIGHRHFFVMTRDLIRIIVTHAVIPLAAWLFFPQLIWVYAIWAALGVVRLLLLVQDWYYDCWLITDMAVVGVEWTGYFERASDRVEYQSIEGVSYKIKGVIPTMFNYGNITLAKLGGPTTVTLKDAYNPKRVEKHIVRFQDKFLTKKNFTDQEVLKKLLSDIVSSHVKEHGLPLHTIDENKIKEFSKKES